MLHTPFLSLPLPSVLLSILIHSFLTLASPIYPSSPFFFTPFLPSPLPSTPSIHCHLLLPLSSSPPLHCYSFLFTLCPPGHTPISLTFDERTVSPLLSLSPDQRTLTFLSKRARRNPQYDPARFDSWPNALCSRLISSGTHSWVVDVSQSDAFKVGVCYASLERKGSSDASRLGYNAQSWVLSHFEDVISFCHAARHDYLSVVQKPKRIGILLDWPGCTLLFFDADSGTTLHTVCHPFTAPLLPACAVGNRSITLEQP